MEARSTPGKGVDGERDMVGVVVTEISNARYGRKDATEDNEWGWQQLYYPKKNIN